jgi:hypothetical protein
LRALLCNLIEDVLDDAHYGRIYRYRNYEKADLDRIIAWWRWFDGGQAPDLVNEGVDYILRPRVVGATRSVTKSEGYICLSPRAGCTLPCVLGLLH